MDGGFTWLGSNERSPDNKLSSIFSTKSKKTYAPFTRTSLPPYWRTITKDSSLASIANSTNMAPMYLSFESLQGVIAGHLLQLFVYSINFSTKLPISHPCIQKDVENTPENKLYEASRNHLSVQSSFDTSYKWKRQSLNQTSVKYLQTNRWRKTCWLLIK